MPTLEMFYGPWQVTFTKSDPDRDNRLVIYGSDGMDGRYQRRFRRRRQPARSHRSGVVDRE